MITKYLEYIKLLESKMDGSLHPKAIINTNLIIKEGTDDELYKI